MSDDLRADLHDLVESLRDSGIELGHLPEAEAELEQLAEPPGTFHRLTMQARAFAARQWSHVLGELSESREVFDLVTRRMQGEALTREQQSAVTAQIQDLMRMVPAGALFLAVEAIPVPGTSAVTPWLLSRLGLLPSRWREAHLLDTLQEEAVRLRAAHEDAAADKVEALITAISDEASHRAAAAHRADLASSWDTDGDGVLSPKEQAAYDKALERLVGLGGDRASERRWYLRYQGQIFGPARLSELRRIEHDAPLLICFDGKDGWVELDLLLDRLSDG